MQREQVSILKILCYLGVLLLVHVIQGTLAPSFRGFHVDLLPCIVPAVALHDGPLDGVIIGVATGIFYDLSFTGLDGIYPIFFMLFGLMVGSLSRLTLSRSYISMMLLTGFEMLLLGFGRYFISLLPFHRAPFLLVMQQVIGGTLLAVILAFIVYVPVSHISRQFERR